MEENKIIVQLLKNLLSQLDPVIRRQVERSKNYPFYRGIFLSSTFPVSKIGNKVWYTINIEMQWYSDRYSTSPSSQTILILYFPIKETQSLFFTFGKPSLKNNVCTFIKNKTASLLNEVASENSWILEKAKFPDTKVENIFTTEESQKILGFKLT